MLFFASGWLCRASWSQYPQPRPPDRSYATGDGFNGDDVYIRDCLDGKHIVVHQYSSK